MPRFVTANIKNNPDMPRLFVREDANAAAWLGDLIGFQEIVEDEDLHDVLTGLQRQSGSWVLEDFGGKPTVPIAWDTQTWAPAGERGAIRLTEPVDFTDGPGGQPARWLTWIDLRMVNRPLLPPLRFVNTHWTNGAWSNPGQPGEAIRDELWLRQYEQTAALIRQWWGAGHTVVLVGDLNNPGVIAPPHASWRWAVGQDGGLDRIGFVQGSVLVDVVDTGWIDLHSDHHARWAALALEPRPPQRVTLPRAKQ